MYYPVSILVLVDLIQQSYHSFAPVGPQDAPQGCDVGPILYFCTLREALLSWFLASHLRAKKIPDPLIDRLFDDNKLANQKFGGLFAAVVGVKWSEAVNTATARGSIVFGPVSNLMKEASENRNEFLHSGCAWGFTREFATRCVDSVGELIALFIALHNEYTAPLLCRIQ